MRKDWNWREGRKSCDVVTEGGLQKRRVGTNDIPWIEFSKSLEIEMETIWLSRDFLISFLHFYILTTRVCKIQLELDYIYIHLLNRGSLNSIFDVTS